MELIVVGCVAVVSIVLSAWQARVHVREHLRTLAQADESRKAAWAQSERMHSRMVSIAFPNAHYTYRQNQQGVADGAQSPTRPHYKKDGPDEEDKRRQLEDAAERLRLQREALRDEVRHRDEVLPIATAADFEKRNGTV